MKIVVIGILVLLLAASMSYVYALTGSLDPDDPRWRPTRPPEEAEVVNSLAGTVLGVITAVGAVVAVLMLVFIGIKYIMGSVEERAEYKGTLLPYIVGAIMLGAAPMIVYVLYDWAQLI